MNSIPKVTIILTSYNHAKFLRESIDSVLNQTFQDFRLIIMDDASNDDSWNIIESYQDPRIVKIQANKNSGGGLEFNSIKDLVPSEYIGVQHSDDIWEPEKLKIQLDYLEKNKNIGAVFSNALIIDESGSPFNDKSHYYYSIFDQPNRDRYEWLNHFFYNGNALCHPSVLIRKECFINCGLYRKGFYQATDFDMWVRLCLQYEIHVFPEKLIRFRVRSGEQNVSGWKPETQIRSQFELFEILSNFKSIQDIEELEKVFPDAQKYSLEHGYNANFILGMIALENQKTSPGYRHLFGLLILFELLNNPESAKTIFDLYGFTTGQFIRLTGEYDVFSVRSIWELNQRITNLEDSIINLKQKITDQEGLISSLNEEYENKSLEFSRQLQEAELLANVRLNNLLSITDQLTIKEKELADITNSKAWKLMVRARRIKYLLIHPGILINQLTHRK